MPERRPPRHEGPRRPQGPGGGHGPGPRPRKPGPRPGPGDASRPPRREAQGAKPPFRPRPAGPHQRPDRPQRPQLPEAAERHDRGEGGGDPDRLQKVLAHAGVGSRRACEDFILQGRVAINGKIVRELGTKVVAGRDRIAVDGQPIRGDERPAYIAVNKPAGYVSTNDDPSGRPRVVDLVPDIPQRVYTVGRLDEMSVGLMLLTNDGELANRLAHPKFGVEKVYRAVIAGTPEPEVYQKLVEGVWLAEGKVRAKRVKPIAHKGDATVVELVLAEGKNREVRRMFAKFGHKVMTLTRVAVGPITLKGLKPGGWRFLTAGEVDLLRKVADGMPVPSGRMNNDRPMRPPTRGPRAPQNQAAPSQGYPPRPQGTNQRPPQSGRPQAGPLRPRSFQGNGEGRSANLGPRPPRPQPPHSQGQGAGRPGRPPQHMQQHEDGPRPGRPMPPRPHGPGPGGPGRPPQYRQGEGPRPGRPPQSMQDQGPRPGRPPQDMQDQGPRPGRPMPPRPHGPGPGRPPQHMQGQGQGPRPGRPQGPPPPPQRPPGRIVRDQPPPRRIIGLELPSEPPPSMRRPPPRPRPGAGGPPNRPLKRPGIPPRRRPRGDEEES